MPGSQNKRENIIYNVIHVINEGKYQFLRKIKDFSGILSEIYTGILM